MTKMTKASSQRCEEIITMIIGASTRRPSVIRLGRLEKRFCEFMKSKLTRPLLQAGLFSTPSAKGESDGQT